MHIEGWYSLSSALETGLFDVKNEAEKPNKGRKRTEMASATQLVEKATLQALEAGEGILQLALNFSRRERGKVMCARDVQQYRMGKSLVSRRLWHLVLLVGFCFLAAGFGHAQETRGTVQGTVTDPGGAIVLNATVQIQNVATKQPLSTKTNASGSYTIPLVQPGSYTLTATAPSFETSRTEFSLDVDQRLQLDIQLRVGAATETVQVQALTPLLQTSDANVGQVIDQRRIAELPLASGSPFELVYSTPGFNVAPGYFSASNLAGDSFQSIGSVLVANGMQAGSTEWTIDGIPNTTTSNANNGNGVAISPPADAVQEFRAEMAYDASSGHTSGFIVNTVLKTGGEKFHGSGYIYSRPSGVVANTWNNDNFAPGQQSPKPYFEYNRYGGSFTGPIWIPKVYDGRRHGSFFAWSGEYTKSSTPNVGTFTVPTAKELSGDFTERLALNPNPPGPSNPYTVYDPATIALVGGVYTEQPMQCNAVYNVVCPARIDKAGLGLMKLFPATNLTGANNGTEANYATNSTSPNIWFPQMVRYDQTVTQRQRFYARLGWAHRSVGPYRNYWPSPAVGNQYISNPKEAVADYTWAASDSLVLDARYGIVYTAAGHQPLSVGQLGLVGFSGAATSELTYNGLNKIPSIAVQGNTNAFGGLPGQETTDVRDNTVHTAMMSLQKEIGRQSIKFGIDARAYRMNEFSVGNASGSFNFGGTYTGASIEGGTIASGGLLGASWASMLLGQPQSGSIDRNVNSAIQSTYWGPYVQDNWRVSDRLSVDLGLRWEYYGPTTDRFNRAVAGFLPTTTNNVTVAAQAAYAAHPDPSLPVSSFQATGGLIFAGQDGRRGFWNRTNGIAAPRLGYSYKANQRIVVRGGFGIFAISNGQDGIATNANNGSEAYQYGYSNTTNLVPTQNNGLSFYGNLSNPFPQGVTPIATANMGVNTSLGSSIAFFNPNLENPYAMQWHQGVQVMLPAQTLLDVEYQGNKGVKLEISRNINGLPDGYLTNNATVPDSANYNYLYAQPISNPLAGLLPGSTLNNSTISRAGLVVPYPEFSGVSEWVSQGASWYHSLVVRADRRFANGYTLQSSYVYQKIMDVGSSGFGTGSGTYLNPGDPNPERGISSLDQRHHLSITGLWDLPIGRGKLLLFSANGLTDRVLGGWQLGGSYQFFSGEPIAFSTNFVLTGNIRSAVMTSHPKVSSANGAAKQWFNPAPFNTTISASQLQGNLRVNHYYYSFLRQGTGNVLDASLHKSVPIAEGIVATFRFEMLNAFNHPSEWSAPVTNPTAGNFGQSTGGPGTNPRYLQFAGRVTF